MADEKKTKKVEKKKEPQVKVNWDMTKAGVITVKDPFIRGYYTDVLAGKKNLKGRVLDMKVKDFLKGIDEPKKVALNGVIAAILANVKMGIPVDDRKHKVKKCLMTVLACRELGIESIPVLVCGE